MKHSIWLVGLLLLTGCPFDDDSGPARPSGQTTEDRYLPRTAPENLIANVQRAYEDRDADAFEAQLADDYTFCFCWQDANAFGPSLSREEDIAIHTNMFGCELLYDLDVTLAIGEVSVDLERTTEGDTLWTATTTEENLFIFAGNPQDPNGDPQAWWISEQSYEVFHFRRSGEIAPESDAPLWEIVAWAEQDPHGSRANKRFDPCPVERSSWGTIRMLFASLK